MAKAAVQFADRAAEDYKRARVLIGQILGPIPRYLYDTLDDSDLAYEIQKRWTARRMEMSQRIVLDDRLLRYMDPDKIQDHWQNFWTGTPLKKLEHSNVLSTGIYNWPRAIVESLTGLIAGSDEGLAYTCNVIPWDQNDTAALTQADIVEKFRDRWVSALEYERTFNDEAANIYALGRNWKSVITQIGGPFDRLAKVENVAPGAVAAFWQSDQRTLECVIVASELLPGEAAALYPEMEDAIAAAVHSPSTWLRSMGVMRPPSTWNLNSTVTILTCWYRTSKHTIGQAAVLMNAPMTASTGRVNAVLLKKSPDTKYPDIPLRCTPRFKTNDRPPDEAQGSLYDIAPIATQLDEVVSAAKDMLWRAIYQRYKLTNAYGKPPQLIPNTSILALRAGQDLARLDDVLQNTPVDVFINRLEDYLRILPGLSEYFLGRVPPSETSGEAITAAINASIQRQVITRTEVRTDERWMYRQIVGQAAQFARWKVNGREVSMAPILTGDYEFTITWESDNPKDAVKRKQLAMAANRAGIIALDTTMAAWGITNTQEELRKIRAERQDLILRPDIVALTEQVLSERANRAAAQAQMAASQAAPNGRAQNASATVAGNMRPPLTEGDNSRGLPPALEGDQGNP